MTGDSGPLDVATFELLAGRLESSPLVDTWEFTPDSRSPRALRVHLDAAAYLPPITAARLDIRWFETADYSIHYVETHPDERWECRWDRHRKRDAPRAHFHPPAECRLGRGISIDFLSSAGGAVRDTGVDS